MASLVVKCYLEQPAFGFEFETRRFTLERSTIDDHGIFKLVQQKVGFVFPGLKGKMFTLFWKDEDDDFVTVSTDEELKDALSIGKDSVCKLFVKVDGDKIQDSMEGDEISTQKDGPVERGDHQKEDPWQNFSPPPPPLPPHHGLFHHPPHHPFGPHQGGSKMMAPFGGPWGWKGGMRKRGPFLFHGFPGHHHRHHHGGPRGHHHFPSYFHGQWDMQHGHGNKHGWKNALRAMVPMPHRRWAKGFIQNWRAENIKNATSTSDSDFNSDGKITMANAGVPQAYADWLEVKLVCWHKKWCSDEMDEHNKFHKKAKNALKDSVPKEFRKWTKWYLISHFGKREAPKFRRGSQEFSECSFKKGKAFKKEHILNNQVPQKYRVWTKQFIRLWRIEKKLDEKNTVNPQSIDSDEFDFETDKDVDGLMSIPEAYKQWLEIFLPRWHTWRGQLERNPEQPLKGCMGMFKDTVPMEFHCWVKRYLSKHYSNNGKEDASLAESPTQEKYSKMLLAFKRKWLEEQTQSVEESENHLGVSSNEEDNPDQTGEPEASFTHLSLDSDDGSKEKPQKVCFEEANGNQCSSGRKSKKTEMTDVMMDFEQERDDDTSNVGKMNPAFRFWAKEALRTWDGQTLHDEREVQQEQESDEDLYISPNMYRWMSKIMMKTQKKKFKQDMKAAKREMKAAKHDVKAAKH